MTLAVRLPLGQPAADVECAVVPAFFSRDVSICCAESGVASGASV